MTNNTKIARIDALQSDLEVLTPQENDLNLKNLAAGYIAFINEGKYGVASALLEAIMDKGLFKEFCAEVTAQL